MSRVRVSAGLAPAPAKPIMTFGAVCRASMRAVMRNYLSSLPGLSIMFVVRHAHTEKSECTCMCLVASVQSIIVGEPSYRQKCKFTTSLLPEAVC